MSKISYRARKDEDKPFRIIGLKSFTDEINQLPKGNYRITVEKWRKLKSNPQLAYLHGLVYPLFLKHLIDAGYEFTSIDEVDSFCKSRFADKEIINRHTGEIITIPDLKRSMNTVEMQTFINAIRDWDAEYLGGNIPDPDPNWKTHKEYEYTEN